MPRRSKQNKPEILQQKLIELLTDFSEKLKKDDLRPKVVALIPAFHTLRDLGSSLIPKEIAPNARDRILAYLRQYPFSVIDGEELMVVSGISEWARRVRELRVQFGWWIYTGVTFKQMTLDQEDLNQFLDIGIDPEKVKPDQYILMNIEQDRDAALRWNIINEIRKKKISVKDKIIEYFRKNVGKEVTGEELSYLAGNAKEWARRVRELRTEEGWPISTKNTGREDLPVGVYVLEEDRQAYEHDRAIPDQVRVSVLTRDHYSCVECGWNRSMLSPEDPRKMLELHHIKHHKDGGENSADNLITLCNVCHDVKHRKHESIKGFKEKSNSTPRGTVYDIAPHDNEKAAAGEDPGDRLPDLKESLSATDFSIGDHVVHDDYGNAEVIGVNKRENSIRIRLSNGEEKSVLYFDKVRMAAKAKGTKY